MSRQSDVKEGFQDKPEPLLTREELIAMVGLIIVSLGFVFLLTQSNVIDYGSPWWTLFIGVPGLVFLGAGFLTTRDHGRVTSIALVQFGVGIIGTVLAISFLVDPTWSFTQGWTLFQGDFWNAAWRWAIVVIGAAFVAGGYLRRSLETMLFGLLVAAVGLIFVFNISWNLVWPVAIIVVGLGVLLSLLRSQQSS